MKKLILLLSVVLVALVVVALLLPPISNPQENALPTTEPSENSVPTESNPTDPTEPTVPTLQQNPFTPSDFALQDDYMACLTAAYQLGIDVSKYQQNVDWKKVADSGITFVMIRIGGRGYGQAGNLYADELAQSHYEGAKAAGLKVGAYFFSQAITRSEAREEAQYAMELTADWQLDMPIVFDWEYVSDTARTANTDAETVTACAAAFCDTILAANKQAMIYVRPELEKLNLEQLAVYDHWVAWYSNTMDYPNEFAMWQYTKTGKVPGISGNVDINLYFIQ
ncbi:MAG: glycoside hydrolase family 25 protein [Oscillospiraceae bacterium]|nr:glycoside hydrolase family 25 protein [Oscillospiraceae bacterium]